MRLIWGNAEKTVVNAVLGVDEALGNFTGPVEFSVSSVAGNTEWENIRARGLHIEDFVPLPPPPGTFPIISDRQFFQAAAMSGKISPDEALAAVMTGTLPKILEEFLSHITDPQQQFGVRMLLSGATQFERHHPLVDQLGQAFDMSPHEIDDLWRYAATL